jgi:hypothetical protein
MRIFNKTQGNAGWLEKFDICVVRELCINRYSSALNNQDQ